MARLVFMGTPEFAVPSLRRMAQPGDFQVVGVVTQPARPAGRGRRSVPPPVYLAADELGLPVMQPERLAEPEALARLGRWAPDVIVVAAYGQILKPQVLELPPHGCLNVHASLLPRHRGAAPVAGAILAGDTATGVTIMKLDAGLDTGPILSARSTPIRPDDTTGTLTARLADLGADLLLETLPGFLAGGLQPVPQDDRQATYARQLRKEDGRLDFSLPAEEVARRVRAFNPWPGAFTVWRGTPLKLLRAAALTEGPSGPPGTVHLGDGVPVVSCGQGALALAEVQPAGKRPMSGAEFARGARNLEGAILS